MSFLWLFSEYVYLCIFKISSNAFDCDPPFSSADVFSNYARSASYFSSCCLSSYFSYCGSFIFSYGYWASSIEFSISFSYTSIMRLCCFDCFWPFELARVKLRSVPSDSPFYCWFFGLKFGFGAFLCLVTFTSSSLNWTTFGDLSSFWFFLFESLLFWDLSSFGPPTISLSHLSAHLCRWNYFFFESSLASIKVSFNFDKFTTLAPCSIFSRCCFVISSFCFI